MEQSYQVQVTNKFDLFIDDDVDPVEILRMQEETKVKKKDVKKTDKPESTKDSKNVKNKEKANVKSQNTGDKSKSTEDKENRRINSGMRVQRMNYQVGLSESCSHHLIPLNTFVLGLLNVLMSVDIRSSHVFRLVKII